MSINVRLYRTVQRTPLEEMREAVDTERPWSAPDTDNAGLGEFLDLIEADPVCVFVPKPVEDEVADVGNVTGNVSPMFTRAFGLEGADAVAPWARPGNNRPGYGLYHLDRVTIADTIEGLRAALALAERLGEEGFADLAPENGWGSHECVLRILRAMVRVAALRPDDYYWRLL